MIPHLKLRSFNTHLGFAIPSPSAGTVQYNICPEIAIHTYLTVRGLQMKALALPIGLMRPCLFECFFPRKVMGVVYGNSPWDDRLRLKTMPSSWERTCHAVAHRLGAYAWTQPRSNSMLESHVAMSPCYSWQNSNSFRYKCCTAEMNDACVALTPTERKVLGWVGCNASRRGARS